MNTHPFTAPDGTAITRHGHSDAPAVVLIHGLGLCQEVWQAQVSALTADFQVITYDLYGHGQSAPPPSTPCLALFAQQLAGVMNACDAARAGLVGFSLGGMIARRAAQDMPARVAALAILHSPHRRTPDAQAAIVKRVEQARSEGPAATVEAALERWFTAPFRAANPEMMDRVRGWVMANDIAIYHRNYAVLANGIDEIAAPHPAITAPALVITGDEDFGNGPEMTQAIAAEIPGAEVLILKGLRHMALMEDPAATNAPLGAFLRRHLAP